MIFWSIFNVALNFQGQLWNLLYLYIAKNTPITKKQEANISIQQQATNVTYRLDLGFSKVNNGNCDILDKNGPLASKRTANTSTAFKVSTVSTCENCKV